MLNRNQKIVVLIGMALLVLAMLFPPWSMRLTLQAGNVRNLFTGFHPIFADQGDDPVNIHLGFLFSEFFVICTCAVGAIALFKSPKISN